MIFQFIKEYNSKQWTIEVMCKVLQVSRSSYYRWLKEPEGKRKRNYMELDKKIEEAYFAAKGRKCLENLPGYGIRRDLAELIDFAVERDY